MFHLALLPCGTARPVTICHLLNLESHVDSDSHRMAEDRDMEKHPTFSLLCLINR